MGPSIQVSEETKSKLKRLKADDETFDELLSRLVDNEMPINAGAWNEETAQRARERLQASRESFERRRHSTDQSSSAAHSKQSLPPMRRAISAVDLLKVALPHCSSLFEHRLSGPVSL